MAGEEKREPGVGKSAAPELRLLDRRAFVAFPPLDVAEGVRITDFGLQIPDVTFPFSVTGGALRYQKKTLQFGFLEVSLDAERLRRAVQEVAGGALELEDVQLTFRTGYLEGQARLKGPAAAPATFKVAFDAQGERLGVYLYDVRLYSFSPTPAAVVPLLLSRSAQSARLLPDVELRGTSGFSARVLPALVQAAAVTRGFRVPSLDGARLTGLDVSATALRLRFGSTGLPPPALLDEELLLALEGSRAFAEAEALLAAGRLADARDAYLRGAEPQDAHPFALERLLGLLVADPGAHEFALDVAQAVARRRPTSAAPLWVEAVVRERRGEYARSAERWLALSALSRKRGEDAAAAAAAAAAARVAEGHAPQMAIRALHELLGLRPDHLPSLQALARAADASSDRAGAIRAYRRISALTRDPAESAEAHVHLARLSVVTEDDVAGARLHCEAALRLSPDHAGALELLGELCHRAGEHLRALKALDRLRDVALGRHDLQQVGRANLLAGRVWEVGLSNLDNALLRYREAVALLPGDPEVLVATAHAAEGLGRVAEAVTGYLQGIELAGASPSAPGVRAAVYRAHRALAVLERTRLGNAGKARGHLEAALGLLPEDRDVLEELIPLYRAQGDAERLAATLEQAAPLVADGPRRAGYLAEAGELQRMRLDNPSAAEANLSRALDVDGTNRVALEGMLAIGEQRRDGPLLCRCLKALAAQARDPTERVRYLRRLAVAAKDLANDLALATEALAEVLRLEPDDLVALGELCGLQRRWSSARVSPRRKGTSGSRPRRCASWRRSWRPGWGAWARRWWRWRRRRVFNPSRPFSSSWPSSACGPSARSTPGAPWRTSWPACRARPRHRRAPRCVPSWAAPVSCWGTTQRPWSTTPRRCPSAPRTTCWPSAWRHFTRSFPRRASWPSCGPVVRSSCCPPAAPRPPPPCCTRVRAPCWPPGSATRRTRSCTPRSSSSPRVHSPDRCWKRWPSSSSSPATGRRPRSSWRARRSAPASHGWRPASSSAPPR
jgi:tetratricopeptide (TPR) repeat protein